MRSCLQPAELSVLRRMSLAPQHTLSGRYAGPHRMARPGRAAEFLDHRPYTPGDSPADVDWKSSARQDKLLIKRYALQTEATTTVLLDASASMGCPPEWTRLPLNLHRDRLGYRWQRLWTKPRTEARPPSESLTPFRYGTQLAAGLAYLLVQQREPAGLALASEGLSDHWPASAALPQLMRWAAHLDQRVPQGKAELASALVQLRLRGLRRGTLVVISDFCEPVEPIVDALAAVAAAGVEVRVLHLRNPATENWPPQRSMVLVDSETQQELRVNPAVLRQRYLALEREEMQRWVHVLAPRKVRYSPVSIGTSYLDTLRAQLHPRST